MLIARYKYSGGWYQGIGEIFGCDTYNEYPSTYPPTLQYEPLIYNNDPNVYATHETTGVRFYNSAVFKDSANNYVYIILVSNPTMYYYSHQYSEGVVNSYSSRGPTNRVYNNYSTGYAQSMYISSSDNFASFESDLPTFTNYQDYYDYATSLHEPPDQNRSGGAGSGYIGNSLLSNKKMVGYNVPISSAESTKTESVDEASEDPVSGKPKIGNGHVRIKFIRDDVLIQHQTINHTITSTGSEHNGLDVIATQISIEKDIVYLITANIVVHSNGVNGRVFANLLLDTSSSQSYEIKSTMSEMNMSVSEIVCESQSFTLEMRIYHRGLQGKVVDIELDAVKLEHS